MIETRAIEDVQPLTHQLDVATMLTTPPPRRSWLLPGLPVGRVGLLVAPGATGKSTLLLQIAVAQCLGRSWPWPDAGGEPTPSRRVLYLAGEDDEVDLHWRLHRIAATLELDADQRALLAANLDLRPIHGLRLAEPARFEANGEILPSRLALELAEEGGWQLIIADPLARLARFSEVDSGQATQVVETFELLARATKAAVIAAHHVSKAAMRDGALDAQHAARGAAALTDGVRWQANLVTMPKTVADGIGLDDEERRRWKQLGLPKANLIGPQPVVWLYAGDGGVLQVATPPASISTRTRKEKAWF